jgi:hypothetical protein
VYDLPFTTFICENQGPTHFECNTLTDELLSIENTERRNDGRSQVLYFLIANSKRELIRFVL